MKASLDNEIEDCTWTIDDILENHLDEYDFTGTRYIDKTIAHHLTSIIGNNRWVYIDEFSGPQLNEISEKALMNIVRSDMIYHNKFQLISEVKKGIRYFRAVKTDARQKEVRYKSITDDYEPVIGIEDADLELLRYKN